MCFIVVGSLSTSLSVSVALSVSVTVSMSATLKSFNACVQVLCAYCGLELAHWEQDDDPWSAHHDASPV